MTCHSTQLLQSPNREFAHALRAACRQHTLSDTSEFQAGAMFNTTQRLRSRSSYLMNTDNCLLYSCVRRVAHSATAET